MFKGKQVMLHQLLLFSTETIICAPCILVHPHISIHVLSNSKCAKKILTFQKGKFLQKGNLSCK